jgi:hypothetical protein
MDTQRQCQGNNDPWHGMKLASQTNGKVSSAKYSFNAANEVDMTEKNQVFCFLENQTKTRRTISGTKRVLGIPVQ